ncbi:MAG TPA: hypothetical protein VF109_08725 [Mycobacteriales bacterium]
MTWLTWRQFRTQAAAVYAAVVAFVIVLAITGPRLLELSRAYPDTLFDHLTAADQRLFNAGLVALVLAPALIGAFWGAPLIARELETGTSTLAWTQSVTRTRWLATKLGILALAAAAAAGVLSLAVSWWAAPLDGATGSQRGSLPARLTPVSFAMRGVVPVGYAVFALVLGVAAGLVVRRAVPAMAVTLALFAFVQIAVPLWVRPHLVPPARQTVTISDHLDGIMRSGPDDPFIITARTGDRGDWVLSNRTVDATGRPAAVPSWFIDCLPEQGAGPTKVDIRSCVARLDDLGYRQLLVYQPASRFWALQWAETGMFLGTSALLAAFCFWWTRRRLS